MITLSRRNLLVLMGTLPISACSHSKKDSIDPNLAKLLKDLSLNNWSVHVGKKLFDAAPDQFDSVSIDELFDQYFSLPQIDDFENFSKAVHSRIRDDFRSDRITVYEGWLFSEKESILYVLTFLFTNLAQQK